MVTAFALACALMTAACTDEFSPTEPSAPALSQNERGWADWEVSWDSDSWDSDSWDSDSSKLVESDLIWTASVASAVIGRNGGTVTLWAYASGDGWQPYHSITVPPGAVGKPTHFVMELGPDPVIDVHLSATEVRSGRRITQFDKPLSLTLTYAGSSVEDPDRLRIVHLVDGTIREAVTGTLDANSRTVTGELWHFSRYALACE
jgi:hypothetical protein